MGRSKLSKLCYLLAFISCNSFAGPADNVPLFYSLINDPRYRDAAFKAQQAFLLQSGISPAMDQIASSLTKEADKEVRSMITNYTFLDPKQVYFVMGAAYSVAIKKEISASFRNPLFHETKNSFTLSKDAKSIAWTIPF